jgi:enterochelin esterase-like enzyme
MLVLLSVFLVGCQLVDLQPVPTLVATTEPLSPDAFLPSSAMAPMETRDVPVTFTPEIVTLLPGVSTREVPPTPSPTTTVEPSATPVVLPTAFPNLAGFPYQATPPDSVPCGDKGHSFRSSLAKSAGAGEVDYHVYLPPCYGLDNRVYPVLYLIHGSIQTDSHWLDLGLAEYADRGIRSGRYPPFIAIMPYSGRLGNMTSGGLKSVEGNIIGDVIPAIDDLYCTWDEASGRSIGGISRGGYWALEIAFRYPELFGAVAGHSSHLRFETDPARYNPLATYADTDLSRTRIWLDRGEKDFLRVGQDQLHESLQAAGIDHEYRINPGGHSDVYWAEHLPEYLDWHLALWSHDRDSYGPCQ